MNGAEAMVTEPARCSYGRRTPSLRNHCIPKSLVNIKNKEKMEYDPEWSNGTGTETGAN